MTAAVVILINELAEDLFKLAISTSSVMASADEKDLANDIASHLSSLSADQEETAQAAAPHMTLEKNKP